MNADDQELLPDQASRPTDFELLQACWLVTTIPNYSCYQPYPNLKLIDKQKTLATPPGKGLKFESPLALNNLRSFGWELFFASHWEGGIQTQNDYQGIILINEESHTILLVHRGMQFTIENLSEALLIATKQVPPIVRDAIDMCNIALNLVREKFPTFSIKHAGFSMGGFLAQVTAAYCNNTDESIRHNVCICFDPPGAADAIHQRYRNNRMNTYVYVTAPNAVNTATHHYGYVRQISHYVGTNAYQGKLKPFFVDDSIEIDTRQAIPKFKVKNSRRIEALFELGRLTFLYHDQEQLRENLGQAHYFDFRHVQNWPLASNRFRQVTGERPRHDPVDYDSGFLIAALDIGVDVLNHYGERGSASILQRSGLHDHHVVQHQIVNPNVTLSAGAHLTDATPQVPELVCLAAGLIVAVILVVSRQNNLQRYTRRRSNAQNLATLGLNNSGDESETSSNENSADEAQNISNDRSHDLSRSF